MTVSPPRHSSTRPLSPILTPPRPLRNLSLRLLFPPHANHAPIRWRHPLGLRLRKSSPRALIPPPPFHTLQPLTPTSLMPHKPPTFFPPNTHSYPSYLTPPQQELYDRLSPPFAAFLSTLTAECAQPVFASACAAGAYPIMTPRGSPSNIDLNFSPSHPVIRTCPVTGWRSLFAAVGLHVSRINGLYAAEERVVREYVMQLLTRSHDCVARMKWNKGACAVWSNACTMHAATVSVVFGLGFARLVQISMGNGQRDLADE